MQSNYADALSGTTIVAPALPLTVTAGHALIGFIWYTTASAPVTSVTTSGSDSCTVISGATVTTSAFVQTMFYCLSVAGGSSYVATAHLTASSGFSAIYVAEYAGVTAFDAAVHNNNATGGTALNLAATFTPSAGNELVIGAGIVYNCNGCKVGVAGNFIPRYTANPWSDTMIADQVQGTAAAVQNIFTTDSNNEWGLSAASFTTTAFTLSTPYVVSSIGYLNSNAQASHSTPSFNTAGATHLVLVIECHNPWNALSIAITGVSDTAGNTFTLLAGPTVFSGASFPLNGLVYYVNSPVRSAADSITVTTNNPTPMGIYVAAVANSSGTPVSSAINSPAAGTTTTAVSSGPVAASANSLLLQFVKNENQFLNNAYSVSTSGFAQDYGQEPIDQNSTGNNRYMFPSWQVQSGSGNYSGNYTYAIANGWQSAIIAIHK